MAKRYSTKRKEMEVDVELEDGSIKNCLIREMMGPALDEWTQLQAGRGFMDKDGNQGMRPLPNLHPLLISKCLYDKATNQLVPLETIAAWNSSTLQGLFEDCQEICGLGDRGREEAKKQ